MKTSLKKSAASGIKWSSASQVARMVMQWITVAILARILSPSDFGLLGIAMVVIGFLGLFRDLGTSAAVIQRKDLPESLISSLFLVNAGFGFVAMLAIFLTSPLVGLLYNQPEVTSLLKVLSLTFLIAGFGIIHKAILERNLEFNKLAKIEIFASALGSIVGVAAAFSGYGVWSVVYQVIATTLTTTVLYWFLCKWKPKAIFHLSEVRGVTNFSLNLTGFNIFNYISRNADNLLIGYYLGPEALGYYNLAYRLMLYPLINVTYVINRIFFPIYSQIRDDNARFRSIFLKSAGAIAIVTFPLMIGMMALREPLIHTIFGLKWDPVIILILILAPVGILQTIVSTTGGIYQAKGRTDWLFRWGIIVGSLFVLSFIVGLKWGIVGVAISYAIMNIILTPPSFVIPFKLINLPMRSLGTSLWRPLFCSLIMLVAILGVKIVLPIETSDRLQLEVLVPVGAITYLSISWVTNRKLIKEMIKLIGSSN